jgi:transposase
LLWEFRRDPTTLTDEDRQKLEELFRRLPKLRKLYDIRVRFKEIFDTAANRRQAARQLTALFVDAMTAYPDLEDFVLTYEKWQDEILRYFDARQTSAGVEGINNKARVAIKRSYGLKSADSLWTRLILDLNRAKDAVIHTIAKIRTLVTGFKAIFSTVCT